MHTTFHHQLLVATVEVANLLMSLRQSALFENFYGLLSILQCFLGFVEVHGQLACFRVLPKQEWVKLLRGFQLIPTFKVIQVCLQDLIARFVVLLLLLRVLLGVGKGQGRQIQILEDFAEPRLAQPHQFP
jgi:hypothetical protein